MRWLLSRGRNAEARREAAKLLGVPESSVALPNVIEPARKSGSMTELLQDQKRFWWVFVIWIGISTGTYCVILWGPTILSQLLKITAHDAAHYFVYASISSMLGRVLFSVLPLYIGRRGAAIVGTSLSTLTMLAIFAFYREFVGDWSVFAILVVVGAAFYSGQFSNMSPYVVEVFPVSLGEPPELNPARFIWVQFQPKPPQPLPKLHQEPFRISQVLEADGIVVGVPDDNDVASRALPAPSVHPQVEHVMQVDVREQR